MTRDEIAAREARRVQDRVRNSGGGNVVESAKNCAESVHSSLSTLPSGINSVRSSMDAVEMGTSTASNPEATMMSAGAQDHHMINFRIPRQLGNSERDIKHLQQYISSSN
jgi:hypothetical protein